MQPKAIAAATRTTTGIRNELGFMINSFTGTYILERPLFGF
jgi:hypothetical protein